MPPRKLGFLALPILLTLAASPLLACAPDVLVASPGTPSSSASPTTSSTGGAGGASPTSSTTTLSVGGSGGASTGSATSSGGSGGSAPLDSTNDPHNCGAAGHDCLGGACVDSACQPLLLAEVAGNIGSIALAANETHLYWTDPNQGLMRMPVPSGPSELMIPHDAPWGPLALDASHVYMATSHDLQRAPLAGGATTLVLPWPPNCGYGGMSLHGSFIYWTSVPTDQLKRVSIDTGEVTYLTGFLSDPSALVADDTGLYWSEYDIHGKIYRTTLDGSGEHTPIAQGRSVEFMALDDTHVYWTNTEPDGISLLARAPKAGGATVMLAAGGNGSSPAGFALDSTHVYWVDAGIGTLWRVPKAGGSNEPLVIGHKGARMVAVNGTAIYWTVSKDNILKLWTLAK